MPTASLLFETSIAFTGQNTLSFAIDDSSVVASVDGSISIVSQSGLQPVKTPDWGTVRAVAPVGDRWLVTGQKPRQAFLAYLLDASAGTGSPLQVPQGYNNIAPNFAEDVIMGPVVKTGGRDTGVWDAEGKLTQVLTGTFVGQANGQFVPHMSGVTCPAPFRDPITSRVVNDNVFGLMFSEPRNRGIRAAWIKSMTGVMSYADPRTANPDARMFSPTTLSPDGRWLFGQILTSTGAENWVFDSDVDQFVRQRDLLGVELSNIVFGPEALFGTGVLDGKAGVIKVDQL